MLDLPGHSPLDKSSLIGGCVRLPLRIDAAQLRAQVDALPAALWGTTGGRVGVHRQAQAIFLRGFAPAEGDKPVQDREALAHLPYARRIIQDLIPASPLRCLLARLPGGVSIPPHIDRAPYFAKTVRLHFPVQSHDQAWMLSGALSYVMKPDEVWALNNSAPHGVWNAHPTQARTHMICDFLPTPELTALIEAGDRQLGMRIAEVDQYFADAAQPGR